MTSQTFDSIVPCLDDSASVKYAKTRRPMQNFEVGIVYQRNCRYYLSVTPSTLVTFKNGKIVEVRPYSAYAPVRTISVDELCQRWEITLDRLDEMTAQYLPVPQGSVKPAPRGSRRDRKNDEAVWRDLRSGRVSRP